MVNDLQIGEAKAALGGCPAIVKHYVASLERLVEAQKQTEILAKKKIKELINEKWISVEQRLPKLLQTVWLTNGKDWVDLGCRAEGVGGWCWASQNGVIYQENDTIVAECEDDDLDVLYWCPLPLVIQV